MSKSKSIINTKKPKNLITKKIDDSDSKLPIIIDFKYFMSQYVHCGIFTNFPKDKKEDISIKNRFFNQFLPYLNQKTFSELTFDNKHNHIIDSCRNKDNVNLIKLVLKKYHTEYGFEDLSETENIFWQMAGPGGMRVIGFRNLNVFQILFLDPHHLVFKNDVFDLDYGNYNYNEHADYYKHHSLVHADNQFLEKCFTCSTFHEIMGT